MRLSLLTGLVLLSMLSSPGCSAISVLDDASRPLAIYELRTPEISRTEARRQGIEIVVAEPVASGALATERIMIRPGPLQAQYLPDVRWADPAPAMLQTLMVRSLTETGAIGSVGRRPVGTLDHYLVLSELTDFQAETAPGKTGATIKVRLTVRVVREGAAQVIAMRTFDVAEQAAATDADAITAAFDRAVAQLLSDMVPWLLARSGASS